MKSIAVLSRWTEARMVFGAIGNTVMVFAMAISLPALASASDAIDGAFLQIEQVGARLSAVPSSLDRVAKAAADWGSQDTAKSAPLLRQAIEASFDPEAMQARIREDLSRVDDGAIDAAAFTKAAAAFEDAREATVEMYESQDQTQVKEVEARLASTEDGPSILQLADQMAGPALAVETALTAQVMYVGFEAFSDDQIMELASRPQEKLSSELRGVVTTLRDRSTNEKPIPKDIARSDESARLTFILARLSKDDLSVLTNFYRSAEGKAKRQVLVDSFRDVTDEANIKMLQAFMAKLPNYFKTHPRPQQR